MLSIFWPLGLFAVAAVGGLVMAMRVLTGKPPPWALSVAHAGLGATGLVLLFIVLQGREGLSPTPLLIALGLLVAAALGGFFLASFHLRKETHPRVALGVHALAAVAGFAILAGVAFGVL
jgi:hypothetical protein